MPDNTYQRLTVPAAAETVQCSVCKEESPVKESVVVGRWVFCADCVIEIADQVIPILRTRDAERFERFLKVQGQLREELLRHPTRN